MSDAYLGSGEFQLLPMIGVAVRRGQSTADGIDLAPACKSWFTARATMISVFLIK
jgi:hypothetical protein